MPSQLLGYIGFAAFVNLLGIHLLTPVYGHDMMLRLAQILPWLHEASAQLLEFLLCLCSLPAARPTAFYWLARPLAGMLQTVDLPQQISAT